MHAAPKPAPIPHLDSGVYRCPISGAPAAGADAEELWVSCPLVNDQVIFWGSCLDLQTVARNTDFLTDIYFDLFHDISRLTGVPIDELRTVCLRHQFDVLNEMLTDPTEDYNLTKDLIDRIRALLDDLGP